MQHSRTLELLDLDSEELLDLVRSFSMPFDHIEKMKSARLVSAHACGWE